MRRPLFHLVRQIVSGDKYFDVSRQDIDRQLSLAGECEVLTEHEVRDEDGQTITTELRLNIAARSSFPQAWQVALKLHRIRIDGIDFEPRFKTIDGTPASGWHRHNWNAAHDSAEKDKVPISDLNDVSSRDQFLIRSFSVMRIQLSRTDHGTGILPFG